MSKELGPERHQLRTIPALFLASVMALGSAAAEAIDAERATCSALAEGRDLTQSPKSFPPVDLDSYENLGQLSKMCLTRHGIVVEERMAAASLLNTVNSAITEGLPGSMVSPRLYNNAFDSANITDAEAAALRLNNMLPKSQAK